MILVIAAGAIAYGMLYREDAVFLGGLVAALVCYAVIRKSLKAPPASSSGDQDLR